MTSNYFLTFEGVVNFIGNIEMINGAKNGTRIRDQYVQYNVCPECNGTRLKKESLFFRIAGRRHRGSCRFTGYKGTFGFPSGH